jgi:multisubunit Na+/H+ antiporter MnhB subunit
MPKFITDEPVLTAFVAFAGTIVTLLVAFGVDLSAEQQAAIAAAVTAGLVLAVAVRSVVTPDK